MIDTDDMERMEAELIVGTAKDASAYANLTPEHSAWWDEEAKIVALMKERGDVIDVIHESATPLLNTGFDTPEGLTEATPEPVDPATPVEGTAPAEAEPVEDEAPTEPPDDVVP